MTRSETTARRSSLDVSIEIETPEQIALSYSVAGIGSRGAAAALDTLICLAALVILGLIVALAASYAGLTLGRTSSASATWVIAAYVLVQFAVVWGYYVVFEGIWDGQTPGKRMMKLRVVRDGGFSVTFTASAVRNLLRAVDFIGVYLVGIVVALTNDSRKRLGDIVAGTFVIKEERATRLSTSVTTPEKSVMLPAFAQLSDEEYAVLDRYMQRRTSLDPARRDAIVASLRARFMRQLPSEADKSPHSALLRLYESERAARAGSRPRVMALRTARSVHPRRRAAAVAVNSPTRDACPST